MKNLKRQDRNGTRTTTDIERKYKLGQIDYTAQEIEELKMKIVVDSSLSASSPNAIANSAVTQALNNKVSKETGKGLSTNDFTDELKDKLDNMTPTSDTLPIGAVIEWDSDTIPENWLLLDGQAVSRTEYSELFALYGTRYGAGDGSTTFNLPNRKTRVSVGKDSTDSDFNTLGKTGGEKAHKLTINEIPNHRHGLYNYNANGSNLTESSSVMLGQTATGWSGNGFTTYEGGGAAHNNLQPYFVTNFIVKAKQGNASNGEAIDTVLYEDTTGTTGNVPLNDDINNYGSFKVYGYYMHEATTPVKTKFCKESEVNSISNNIDLSGVVYSGAIYTYFIAENASVNNSTITRGTKWKVGITTIAGNSISRESGEYVYITKVVGYR